MAHQGPGVAVVGKLRFSEWTGRDGERRSKIQVVADAVQFLGKPTKAGDPDGGMAGTDDKPADRPALGKYRKAG
jgi:single-stranded DNA-binding protein